LNFIPATSAFYPQEVTSTTVIALNAYFSGFAVAPRTKVFYFLIVFG
jgi:hypothetical protein